MSALFSQVLNMTMTGSVVILLVILVRLALRQLPKRYAYVLWSVVLFRLLCPISIMAPVSVLEAFSPEVQDVTDTVSVVSYIPETPAFSIDEGMTPSDTPAMDVAQTVKVEEPAAISPMYAASLVWCLGMAVLLAHSGLQYFRLRSRLVGAIKYRQNIYFADHLETAFVLGIAKPRIYLPSNIPMEARKYIIAHERHHIHRGDHIVKLLAFLSLCIHWFNPLVWVAFILSSKDMEMSCDEAVIRKMGPGIRADYSEALLQMTTHRQFVPGMPIAFGEGDTSGRVRNMAKWKQPKIWISMICIPVCVVVLAACALNPSQKTPGDLSRMEIGELSFTLPSGFTCEENKEATPKSLTFQKSGRIVGGVYELPYPDGEYGGSWDWVEALNIPENVPGDRLMMYVSNNEEGNVQYVAYGNNGIEETLHYLKQGSEYVYDLWLDMQILTELEKAEILNAVYGEEGSKTFVPYDISRPFSPLKPLPEGIRTRTEANGDNSILIGDQVIGGIRVRPAPEGFLSADYFSRDFLIALGVQEASDETLGHSGGGNSVDMDYEYFSDVPPGQERTVHTYHKFYVTRDDYIFDIWFNLLAIDSSVKDQLLDALDILEIKRIRDGQQSYEETTPADPSVLLPFEIAEMPEGYTFDVLGSSCVLFIRGNDIVGGVDVLTIPDGVYDPTDTGWFWLEKMGMSDFENPELCYMGSMSSGDNGWLAEFASDVPEGTPVTQHRRHIYRVVGDKLCDIWLDMIFLNYNEAEDLSSSVRFADAPKPGPGEQSPEDMAFEKTAAIMDAVSNGSCHILAVQENTENEGPSGYERHYYYHEGNYLYTSQVITEGENITEAGAYYNRYALLIEDDRFFSNEGHQGEEEILWSEIDPVEQPDAPWLGNHVWNKSFATYMDTLTDENGVCMMFRYDKKYADQEAYSDCYFVNFNFSPDGAFRNVQITVNLFMENEFTITESIVSMDGESIADTIHSEYLRAANS